MRHTTPLQVCGSSSSTVITPAFITPPNTPCGCSDVLSHPLFITPSHLSHPQAHLVGVRTSYHTPWFITPPLGPLRAALYHPGYTRYHTFHRIPHPVMISALSSPGCTSYGIYVMNGCIPSTTVRFVPSIVPAHMLSCPRPPPLLPPHAPSCSNPGLHALQYPPSPHWLYDSQHTLDKLMHYLPQLSDFVPLKNGS